MGLRNKEVEEKALDNPVDMSALSWYFEKREQYGNRPLTTMSDESDQQNFEMGFLNDEGESPLGDNSNAKQNDRINTSDIMI